jgi:hypothetical protein
LISKTNNSRNSKPEFNQEAQFQINLMLKHQIKKKKLKIATERKIAIK